MLLVGMQIDAATMDNSMEVPLKTKNKITIPSRNLTPRHISRKDENSNSKGYMLSNIYSKPIFNIQLKCPSIYVYICFCCCCSVTELCPILLQFHRLQPHLTSLSKGFPRQEYQCMLSLFNHVQLFVTLWTVAHQAPLSMEFFRQEY